MISFIIPCYNEEKTIAHCIKSILSEINREKIEAEIIVVDNKCTDDTASIAAKLGVIVIQEPTKGVVWARQKGYKQAKYDLIANIDADSYITNGWLKVALDNIKDNNVVAITGPLNYYDSNWFIKKATKIYYVGAYISNMFIGATIQGGNCIISIAHIKKCAMDMIHQFHFMVRIP